MKDKLVGFVWNVNGDEFVHMCELSKGHRSVIELAVRIIEHILCKNYETEGESFPLIREAE